MSGFLGRYEHQLDEKGRVSLPSAFRKEAEGESFVLLQWEKPYLTLFPQRVWAEVQTKLLEFRKSKRSAWNHVREILNGNIDRIELWDPDRWESEVASATSAELEDFGHRIFG